jgi:hypothetical protein
VQRHPHGAGVLSTPAITLVSAEADATTPQLQAGLAALQASESSAGGSFLKTVL